MDNNTKSHKPQEYFFKLEPQIGGDSQKRTFSGTAYGGGIITDHGWWDRVIFDLKTTRAPEKMPVLLDHDSKEIVGFTENVLIGSDIRVAGIISNQDTGKKVAAMADEGFPWQMSVRIYPETISFIGDGDSVEVNGSKHDGPVAVLRDSLIREVSFCALGADRDTIVNIFNLEEKHMPNENVTNPVPNINTSVNRDLAIQALNDEKLKFKAEADEMKTKFAGLLSENADLKSKLQSTQFENRTLNDSLEAARKEASEFRAKYDELSINSRKAVLEADYKRCGLEFKADDEVIKAILGADPTAFEAFRKVLANFKPPIAPMAPPAGAFVPITQVTDFTADGFAQPQKSLVAMAAERGKKEAN